MAKENSALSVTEALNIAKERLEDISLKVIGEISSFKDAGRSGVYFSIKDDHSTLQCMMWQNEYRSFGLELGPGMLVELIGRYNIYAPKGTMRFKAMSVSLAGEGQLRMQVAKLAAKLQTEGLMSDSRKMLLPPFPEKIGVVTSPTGSVIKDVIRTLNRRYPIATVLFAGTKVEGKDAPDLMINAIHEVADAGAQVILLVRGGGSYEDLMPFNSEELAREIAGISVPIVTGIGHEPDTSIADLVADLRASTPTAAAEAVAPSLAEISSMIASMGSRMDTIMRRRLATTEAKLDKISMMPIFADPMRLIQDEAITLDDLELRLKSSIPNRLEESKSKMALMKLSLEKDLALALDEPRHEVSSMHAKLESLPQVLLNGFKEGIAVQAGMLSSLSPLAVLTRGYSIAKGKEGRIVKSVSDVLIGEKVSVQVSDGYLGCRVENKSEAPDNQAKGV